MFASGSAGTSRASYVRWRELVESWSSSLTPAERDTVFGGAAVRIYGLDLPAP